MVIGFNLYQASAAGNFFDLLGFDIISFGVAGKILDQFIKSESRQSLSFDVGTILSYNLGQFQINMLHIGVSIVDIFASPLKWSNGSESFLPPQIYTGIRADLFDDNAFLYLNNGPKGLAVSTEILLEEKIALQIGSDFSSFSTGVSIQLDNITGFADENYNMRVDYGYAQHEWPHEFDPSQVLSLSILGESRPKTPQIKTPERDLLINTSEYSLQGYGPKNTTIRIYSNDTLKRTIQSNRFGFWKYTNVDNKTPPIDVMNKLNQQYPIGTLLYSPIVLDDGDVGNGEECKHEDTVCPDHLVDIPHIQQFSLFLKHCGGFAIW